MGLTDLFNQWIVERGSAVVQEKHLALFRDQLVAADKKATLLETENSILKAENDKLKSEAQNLHIANNELATKIQIYENPKHKTSLDKTKVSILLFLTKQDKSISQQIATSLNINEQVVQFHLTELDNINMVHSLLAIGTPTRWMLKHEGRRYLIENNLLS